MAELVEKVVLQVLDQKNVYATREMAPEVYSAACRMVGAFEDVTRQALLAAGVEVVEPLHCTLSVETSRKELHEVMDTEVLYSRG